MAVAELAEISAAHPARLFDSEPIAAAQVTDMEGRQWTLLPLAWQEHAPLCSGTTLSRTDAEVYVMACRARSAWASPDKGFCCRCFSRLVLFGVEQ